MRIGINALSLVPSGIGGLENYLCRLLQALARDDRLRLVVFTSPAAVDTLRASPGAFELRELEMHSPDPALERELEQARVDLWWCPWVDWRPLRPGVPLVVTVPDLQHEHLPQLFTPAELSARRTTYFSAAHVAAAVMTFSEHAREDLCRLYGVPRERVHAVPLAEGFDWERSEPRSERTAALRASVGEGFLYYPANAWPHKDHATLLSAVRGLLDGGRDVRVVLTGRLDIGDGTLPGLVRRLALDDHVRLLGWVEPPDVRALYQLAAAVVLPSQFEGFGFPVLEAMRSGTPVICAEATSLPELGAQAALYFPAGDPRALAERIARLLDEPGLRRELIERGRARAQVFSWPRTAERVADVFGMARSAALAPTAAGHAVDGMTRRLSHSLRAVEHADTEASARLEALKRLTRESAERLDQIARLTRESAERLDQITRLTAESAERLDQITRLATESAELRERIARLAAGLRDIEALAQRAAPQARWGWARPRELQRVRDTLDRLRRALGELAPEAGTPPHPWPRE